MYAGRIILAVTMILGNTLYVYYDLLIIITIIKIL
jgi:hypothetical protein